MTSLRLGPARLLVADDNKVNRLLLARSLELEGHSVASATDGKAALAMLAEGGFDLLLLDMEMPEMNGFQFSAERVGVGEAPIRIGISIGIGISDVVAGYTGTRQRATYTCVGETVNLASRLEAHTKARGRALLLDAATAGALGEGDAVERLGDAQFHGIAAPVEVYAAA